MEKFNKLELMVWLVGHLEQWPVKEKRGPKVEGWSWFLTAPGGEIAIGLDILYEAPQTITMLEWKAASILQVAPAPTLKGLANEAMIDIETFDTEDNAVMFQVGLIFFNKKHEILKKLTWNLNVDEQIANFRTMSASTIAFHLAIPANALAALNDPAAVSMVEFADHLIAEINEAKPERVWAKGDMDFKVMKHVLTSVDRKLPWNFRQPMELRTLMRECGVKKGDVSHTAIEDCEAQLKQLAECRELIQYAKCLKEAWKQSFDEAPSAKELSDFDQQEGRIKREPDSVLAKEAVLQASLDQPAPEVCLYAVDQGVTDTLPGERVAYRADCGYQKMFTDGDRVFPEGKCTKCKREIELEHDTKDLLEGRTPAPVAMVDSDHLLEGTDRPKGATFQHRVNNGYYIKVEVGFAVWSDIHERYVPSTIDNESLKEYLVELQ
ncbi:MAG: 3'-5' exoribonuclease [Colwellia sp.]|nr:3'-5' exoribonuclease [Colwellia sp.]